jgi:hypothetical protein
MGSVQLKPYQRSAAMMTQRTGEKLKRGLGLARSLIIYRRLGRQKALASRAFLCVEELERLGNYEFNAIDGEKRRFLWPDWQSTEQIRQWLAAGAGGIASGDIYARLSPP